MAEHLVVVDYGSGNIRSVVNALERVSPPGHHVRVSQDPKELSQADRLILPGVGAFSECKRKLGDSQFLEALKSFKETERPFLGICVGMQILAEEGEEFTPTRGLGWLKGRVRRLQPKDPKTKLPHVGWSLITPKPHPLFDGIPEKSRFYFVHSYILYGLPDADIAASAHYGEDFAAAVIQGSILGCQFHPEKSDKVGLQILSNFCKWKP